MQVFVWVVDDSLEMGERGLREHRKKGTDREKGKVCLVGLKAAVVDEITAHPSDLAELFALSPGEDFKLAITDERIVVSVLVVGPLRIGVKRCADRQSLKNGVHCKK